MHKFDRTILRAYDIRGIYEKTLFDIDAYYVGNAFGRFLKEEEKVKRPVIAVGCDGRLSSPSLKANLVKGLIKSGVDVIDVGLVPTPGLYFSVHHLSCDAGVMVTGSHNPKNHNGFKMMIKNSQFFGDRIKQLSDFVDDSKIEVPGTIKHEDISDDYVDRVLGDFNPKSKKLKVAWDAGNGATCEIVKKICKKLDAQHHTLYTDIDGNFPNHHPDPTVEENLKDLAKVVIENGCDVGIGFDGDGDRIGVVDDKGQMLFGDQLMVFFARDVLSQNKGRAVIGDVKASDVLFAEIEKSGGVAIMEKTGHSLIKNRMKIENAVLAGEMSGHIFFADKYYGFDDGVYSAIRLLNILASSDKKLSQERSELPKTFSTTEIRIHCREGENFELVNRLKLMLTERGIKFSDIDGVRMKLEGGWFIVRASNTEAALVARCEASSSESLKKIISELDSYIKTISKGELCLKT